MSHQLKFNIVVVAMLAMLAWMSDTTTRDLRQLTQTVKANQIDLMAIHAEIRGMISP